MTRITRAAFDKLLSQYNGVPAGNPTFDAALERLTSTADVWDFSEALRDAVHSRPTPRGWSITGYSLAASGYLDAAIESLKKGGRTNTTHEVIASCCFLAGKDEQALVESRKSTDSGLHNWYRVDPAVPWCMSLIYALERPPVFGTAPRPQSGPLQLVALAVETFTALIGSTSNDPGAALIMRRKLSHLMKVCRDLGFEADPELLVRMMREWKSTFEKCAASSSTAQTMQKLSMGE